MKKTILISAALLLTLFISFYPETVFGLKPEYMAVQPVYVSDTIKSDNLILGAFSVSLSVKDLKISKEFYEKLGFKVFGGGMERNYLIMKNGSTLIGLFRGMFEGNILTFNPGWDENASNMKIFDDVRKIQSQLKSKGVNIENEIDEKSTGPAYFMITDPDGNKILLDQHR